MKRLKNLRAKSHALVGFFTLTCGFLMMWASVRGGIQENESIAKDMRGAIAIDPLRPNGANNGALVVAAAKFSSPELLDDEFLKPGPYLVLRRRVEMFQWAEESVPTTNDVSYKLGWYEGQIDFFRFRDARGHENPLLRVQPFVKQVSVSTFGAFDGSVILRTVRKLSPLKLTPELVKDPSIRIENDALVIPRDPSAPKTALGDMRVSYEVLQQGDYTILTRQEDERTLIGAAPAASPFMQAGLFTPDELRTASSERVQEVSDGLLYMGAVILFLGLVSVFLPVASSLDLRPRANLQGVPALVAVCAGVSFVTLVIFFILSRIG